MLRTSELAGAPSRGNELDVVSVLASWIRYCFVSILQHTGSV
jgi:hypothetical protein